MPADASRETVTSLDDLAIERMETVTSPDGTPIAYERTGAGPPLVLVHGTTADHTRWAPVLPALEARFAVYAIDRRGRGDSGDAAAYALDREAEDVAAVVESIDDPVVLLGHSYGALCALEAARLTDGLRGLVLYEPPIPIGGHQAASADDLAAMRAHLDAGEDEAALVVFFTEVADVPPAQLDVLRSAPNWPARVAAAHTAYREARAADAYAFDPARFDGMTTPTLLLAGGESPTWFREAIDALEAALPDSRVAVLEGQEHVAMNTAPERFVEAVLAFVESVD